MPSEDRLAHLRAFPRAPAPNHDASAVESNLPEQDVALLQNILAYHVAHRPNSTVFGNRQADGLKLVEAFVRPRTRREAHDAPERDSSRQGPGTQKPEAQQEPKPDALEAVSVCEIVVEEDMLNVHGVLSGAAAMLLIDIGTFSALFALGVVTGVDPTGFSASMNLVWHAPATRGTKLRLVSTSLTLKPRMAAARCEVLDGQGRLLISATQMVSPIQGLAGEGAGAGRGTTARAARSPAVAVPAGRAKL